MPAHAGDKWHLDEVLIKTARVKHWLWRTVDQAGMVLYVLVQSRRNRRAAKRLLRKLLKRQCRAPRVMTTGNLFPLRRDHVTASENRAVRARASEVWADISGVAAAA